MQLMDPGYALVLSLLLGSILFWKSKPGVDTSKTFLNIFGVGDDSMDWRVTEVWPYIDLGSEEWGTTNPVNEFLLDRRS